VYSALPAGFTRIDQAMLASASDEAEHTQETSNIHKFNIGSWGPLDNPDNLWNNLFTGIRRANYFLSMSDSIDWSNYIKNPTPENLATYNLRSKEIFRMKYEVRFLRAYYYFELVKRYGGVPILIETLSIYDDNSGVTRNTLSECIKFIIDECDSAAAVLPTTYTQNDDFGRVTKGAALALKSRTLLYAASDLFNTTNWAGAYSHPVLISINGDRTAQWQAAADASKDVIDLGIYSLSNNYSQLFLAFNNPEIIFTRRGPLINNFDQVNYPIGYDMGRSGTTPTQNMVDAYEVKLDANTAVPFDWNNTEHAANPYSPQGTLGRDPRLSFSIITNNSLFKNRKVETFSGGLDGKGIALATKTGYYLKKYVDESLNLLLDQKSARSWHIFRLAEIYLNYAEALNEANPGHPDIKLYVDMVRGRQGVQMPPLPAGLSQAEMRERIRNERRVELAFEEHRIWDLRRWMLAPSFLGSPVKGVEITKTGEDEFTYSVITVENRVFQPKMYFYPIPQSEINIMKNWVQNPLW
jgi:starch-binding outer membrane protein, SusD/RagB family